MSRVIKFRAWVISGNYSEMLSNVQNHIGAATGFGHLLQGTAKGIDRSNVMQFTGLTDKNGVEIYEGDILEMHDLIVPVIFDDGSFQIKTNDHQGLSSLIQDRARRFVIAGNIYQNPELLEQAK